MGKSRIRRSLVTALATLGVMSGLLAGGTAEAATEPPLLMISGPGTTTTTSPASELIAILYDAPSTNEVIYDWDLDNDGAYDDYTGQFTFWSPAGKTPGAYTVRVRAVIDGQTFTDSDVIYLELPTSTTFTATLPPPFEIAVGDQASLFVTLSGEPSVVPTMAWDLDNDGAFDDSTEPFATFTAIVPGTFTVRVRVHDQTHPADPPAIATTKVNVIPAPPKVTLGAVTLSGTARVGYLLTSGGGAATPSDATRTIQWLRDGVPIAGATGATYRVTTADPGRRITVRISATKDGYVAAAPATSKALAIAAYNLTRPSWTGITRVGRKLTGKAGTWVSPSYTTSYRWLRDGKAISGATRSTYVTNRFDRGHKISFRVYKVRSGFPTTSATSTARTITR